MGYKIIYAPDVKNDIQSAVSWYNQHQKGLGKLFLKELIKHFNLIKNNPNSFAVRYDNTRCLPIKKYPYMIHYKISETINTIFVNAVFHTSINPESWENRS